jgi:hypothetical protein
MLVQYLSLPPPAMLYISFSHRSEASGFLWQILSMGGRSRQQAQKSVIDISINFVWSLSAILLQFRECSIN